MLALVEDAPDAAHGSRCLEVTATVDEMGFQGSSAFLLGTVLDRFFARHASANSFSETVLRSASRGEIMHCSPRTGARASF